MNWGAWGQAEYCPPGTFATAFEIKVESEDATDDTSMNGIRLYCNNLIDNKQTKELTVSSTVQKWGDWMGKRECPSGQVLTGLRMKSEEDQGNFVDDTAANDLDMQCSHSTFTLNGGGNHWGYWSTWASCPEGWAICGLETRVESESAGDDTALNDVRMYCCAFTAI
ncbi:hypothetical protein Pmani_035424 [Petrolisthes manimaculis]|nr:hypothetical protein Pmani_035424 [Petrolisthes manimaculis]